jgi:predicted transposase YdaD
MIAFWECKRLESHKNSPRQALAAMVHFFQNIFMERFRMSTPYDDSFKALVRDDPLAFVRLVFPKAQLVRQLREKLKDWKLEVDALLEIILETGLSILLHIEFQTYNDSDMAKRLLRYHVLIEGEYNMPVYSCVIHILHDGQIPVSPLRLSIETGEQTIPTIQFYYQVIELGQVSAEEILRTGQAGLLPLLPFTKGGASRPVVETMFEELTEAGKANLFPVAQTLASLAFSHEKDAEQNQEWLIRRFKQMFNVVKDTPVYKEMTRDAHEEGLKEGLEKGREEGLKEGLEKALLGIVRARFPRLEKMARVQSALTDNLDELNDLIVKVSMARDAKEAKRFLIGDEDEDED